jgi:hypothetical protein
MAGAVAGVFPGLPVSAGADKRTMLNRVILDPGPSGMFSMTPQGRAPTERCCRIPTFCAPDQPSL